MEQSCTQIPPFPSLPACQKHQQPAQSRKRWNRFTCCCLHKGLAGSPRCGSKLHNPLGWFYFGSKLPWWKAGATQLWAASASLRLCHGRKHNTVTLPAHPSLLVLIRSEGKARIVILWNVRIPHMGGNSLEGGGSTSLTQKSQHLVPANSSFCHDGSRQALGKPSTRGFPRGVPQP